MARLIQERTSYRPSLKSLFIAALKATAKEDRMRDDNDSLFRLMNENETFNERVIVNFLIIATGYYKHEEIQEFFEEEFFKDDRLPSLD